MPQSALITKFWPRAKFYLHHATTIVLHHFIKYEQLQSSNLCGMIKRTQNLTRQLCKYDIFFNYMFLKSTYISLWTTRPVLLHVFCVISIITLFWYSAKISFTGTKPPLYSFTVTNMTKISIKSSTNDANCDTSRSNHS